MKCVTAFGRRQSLGWWKLGACKYLNMFRMIFLKNKLSLVLMAALFWCVSMTRVNAQDLSIATQISPTISGPQVAGTVISYVTTVSLSVASVSSFAGTLTLNFEGMTLSSAVNVNGAGVVTNTSNTASSYMCEVSSLHSGDVVVFTYTGTVTSTSPSAIIRTKIDPIGFTDSDPNNNISDVQTFIKPILVQPSDVTVCSGNPVNKSLVADNLYTSYAWSSTVSNSSTVSVQGPLGSGIIQDIVTNTGIGSETVSYIVTPELTATVILANGTSNGAATTLGDPKTFVVTLPAPLHVTSVAVTGNGVIYSDQSAVFTPSSNAVSPIYTWYTSVDKISTISAGVVNGVLTESNLSLGTHTYYVAVTGVNGCEGPIFPVSVKVLSMPVHVQKTLTPNGDGIEDTWDIKGLEQYPKCNIRVFDRWGEVVYSSVGYNTPWTGTFHNNTLAPATYYYIIDLEDGSAPIGGDIDIIK